MSAIFISYTNRDEDGKRWAPWLMEQLRAWTYDSLFLDKDATDGIRGGDDWRRVLHQKLAHCRAVIAICSEAYESSPWCMAEVGIAADRGKRLFPVLVGTGQLPLLLQQSQSVSLSEAIQVQSQPEASAAGLRQLRDSLDAWLDWRDRLKWTQGHCPFPGLAAFEERHAPVFFGRDATIAALRERTDSLAGRLPALLLLLGASGYGKSSLVKAGLLPALKGDARRDWLVLEPFRPGPDPLGRLGDVVANAFRDHGQPPPEPPRTPRELLDRLEALRRLGGRREAPVVLVVDQLEEVLMAVPTRGSPSATEGERFLGFLRGLLDMPLAGVMVIATLRTDALAPLQALRADLLRLASPFSLEPIRRDDYGELINGPAGRSGLQVQPGLPERLVAESGSGDALPLLAFTLEKLWHRRQQRGTAVAGPEGQWWDLTIDDYERLGGGVGGGGVAGVVSQQASEAWDEATSSKEEAAAMREAFLTHLVRLSEEGLETKQPARWDALPKASQPILKRFVEARLLVVGKGTARDQVEIAHEALLRTWPTLVDWLREGREELLQRRRVERLCGELKADKAEPVRRAALVELARMASLGGVEGRAVAMEAADPLAALLQDPELLERERDDAAVLLALIGVDEPLRGCWLNPETPVAVRRRAAECLGLLASRCGDPLRRRAIEGELETWMRQEMLDIVLQVDLLLQELDPSVVKGVVEATVSELAGGFDDAIQLAREAGQLPADFGEEQRQELFQQLVADRVSSTLRQSLCRDGVAPGWAEHDRRLPVLQGASRGLQLAASAELPLLGSGPGREVPMLTLRALKEGEGLRIRTEVVTPTVWRLPLPECAEVGPQQLELVVVPDGSYEIGSPLEEAGRDVYPQFRQKCEGVNVEAQRQVTLKPYALVRHPITQGQWRAVAALPKLEHDLKLNPGIHEAKGLWESHAQPSGLAVDSVSWNDCQEWLKRLNHWLTDQWLEIGGQGEPPVFGLPSESQWEAACRAGSGTPFHFGDALDVSWANYDGNYTYRPGRKGVYRQRVVSAGASGLVNRWGLAEMHGQLLEWCADQWHRDPVEGAVGNGSPLEGPDLQLEGNLEQSMRLLRGGSWVNGPRLARAAMRDSLLPGLLGSNVGVRPGCFSPPGLFLYT